MKHKGIIEKVSLAKPYLRVMQCIRFFGERFGLVKQYSPPGIDASPAPGARPLLEAIGGDVSQMTACEFLDAVAKVAERGEIRIYATEDGENVSSFVFCKNSGEVHLNGDSFGALIKIEELTTKINELVTMYNSHLGETANKTTYTAATFVKEDYENPTVLHGEVE